MLANLSQYLPQGWGPQLPGFQGFGSPQIGMSPFGQAMPLGYDPAQTGVGQHPYGWQTSPFGQSQAFGQNQPFGQSPYLQSHNPFFNSQGHVSAHHSATQQIVPVLGQLAQQIAVQSAVTQQIGAALHQLAQQLASQGQQGFGPGGSQSFVGLNPQAQGWGANRQQTIQ